MVTMYYVDGDHLMLTRYCMANNQPTLRAARFSPGTGTLTFDFVKASNLTNSHTGHMHHVVFHFVDNSHMSQEWTFRKDQKDAFKENVTYTRVR